MPSPESIRKAALRAALEARRNAIPPETRAALSAALCARAAGQCCERPHDPFHRVAAYHFFYNLHQLFIPTY